jgi:3-keto-5-aminohexanoate cleavage enzyme
MTRDVVIVAAPNGARKTKTDHKSIPLTIDETVSEAVACFDAGATVLHAHVRGAENEHLLDAGLYRELLAEMSLRAPQMLVQITSEAVGRYSPEQQVDCIKAVVPKMASMALREISSDFSDTESTQQFYNWCDEAEVQIQHILFSNEDLEQFLAYREQGVIPTSHRCVLFVLGRYNVNFQSNPSDLEPFLQNGLDQLDWFTCAFGHQEQQCVMAGIDQGGHARVGFENNLYLPDGELASSSAELVSSLADRIRESGNKVADSTLAAQLLDIRNP